MKHQNYQPVRLNEWGEDWTIFPVDGYGNEQIIRQIISKEKIDAIWFMTDPRFYMWLFNMSDEIKDKGIPLLYNTIWDANPVPTFNKPIYDTCDFLGCISKLTYAIMQDLNLAHKAEYIPHAVDINIFKPFAKEEILKMKDTSMKENKGKFIVFYNSRNARRKRTSDVLLTFKSMLDKVGQDKAFLLMKTDPGDQEGGNLIEVAKMLDLKPEQIAFVPGMVPAEQLAQFYNMADITVCHSDNEGFGLSCLESLSCGTPVVSMKTGGLQDQVIDPDGNIYGVAVEAKVKSLQGSQQIPYIFSDLGTNEDWLNAYLKMYNMTWDERKEIGKKAVTYVNSAFSMDNMIKSWHTAFEKYINQYRNSPALNRIRIEKV